jgi:hypothetical protein
MLATHFFESLVLNTFNNITAVGQTNLHIALYATDPTDTGTAGVEILYDGYQRQSVVFTVPAEGGGGMAIQNTMDLQWATAPTDAGQARYLGLLDSGVVGAGNMLLRGELTRPLDIRANQQPNLYAGHVSFYLYGDSTLVWKTRVLNLLRGQNMIGVTPFGAIFDGDPETGGSELAGASYARAAIEFSLPEVQPAGFTLITNTNVARFPNPTTTWGMFSHFVVMDAQHGGQPLFRIPVQEPEVLHPNYVPQTGIGDIRMTLN